MYRFLLAIYFIITGTVSLAAISKDDLQTLITQKDVSGVEAAIHTAHQQSLSGDISYDDLRSLTIVLFRTHPDTVDFLDQWLKEIPGSPYALTAKAWAHYNNGGMVRGTKYNRNTPHAALEARHALHEEGMQLALQAYNAAPDYVPASDAVIRLQWRTGFLWNWQVNKIIGDTMDVTPNFGTLTRASQGRGQDWGGLCETHARKITGVSYDACIVGLLAENRALDDNWSYVADVLDREDHPILEEARVRRAVARGTDADMQLVVDYVASTDLTFPWLRTEIEIASQLGSYRYFSSPPLDFVDDFHYDLQAAVRKQLETDPFNLSLLNVALYERPYIKAPPLQMYDTREYLRLMTRTAVVQPYHMMNWTNISLHDPAIVPDLNTLDMGYENAMAYSGHSIFAITNYFQKKRNHFYSFKQRGESAAINGRPWPSEEDFDQEVSCRLVRLLRLFDDAAERSPEHRNHIDGFRIDQNLEALEADLRDITVCAHLWDSPIETLYFTPHDLDRRDLLDLPLGKYEWHKSFSARPPSN